MEMDGASREAADQHSLGRSPRKFDNSRSSAEAADQNRVRLEN
jgi:hypothetical protein